MSFLVNLAMLCIMIMMFLYIYNRTHKFNELYKITKRFLINRRTHFIENDQKQITVDDGDIMFDGLSLFKDEKKYI